MINRLAKETHATKYEKFYSIEDKKPEWIDQLLQLRRIVADGDLISKEDVYELERLGFVERCFGFNIITPNGINYLIVNRYISM